MAIFNKILNGMVRLGGRLNTGAKSGVYVQDSLYGDINIKGDDGTNGYPISSGNLTVEGITTTKQVLNALGGISGLPTPVNDGDAINKEYLKNDRAYLNVLYKTFFDNLKDGSRLFENDQNIQEFYFDMPNSTSAYNMFTGSSLKRIKATITGAISGLCLGSNVESAEIIANANSLQSVFHTCYKLKSLKFTSISSGLNNIAYLCWQCTKLEHLELYLTNYTKVTSDTDIGLGHSDGMITGIVSLPNAVTTGKIFVGAKMSKEMIESSLTALPDRTGMVNNLETGIGVANFTSPRNADILTTVDWTIAENKNWIVER